MAKRGFSIIVALLALLAIGLSLIQLRAAQAGVTIARGYVGTTPITIYRPQSSPIGPVVVLAHGFAGSQQLMQSFAIALARNGYGAVTFDFLGHGRNPAPLGGSITREDGATRRLVAQTASICAYARGLGDGRLAILGHSMASDVIVRVAQAHPEISATIAVSMFSPAVTRMAPRNLLVIVGAWEGMLRKEALRAVGQVSAPARPVEGVTYGSFAGGNARRASFSPHVEHISVLYSQASMVAAVSWLDGAFRITRTRPATFGMRGPWILLLIAGVTALGWPLSMMLPIVSRVPLGAGLGWGAIWPALVVPALLTPLVLRFLPTHFLPILVGDYLALHFALYGVICFLFVRWRAPYAALRAGDRAWSLGAFAAAVLLVTLYGAIALGWSIDLYVTSFALVGARLPLLLAMLVGTFCYFLSDEWLTRGLGAARGGYPASKIAFLMSLLIAVTLDFERLFFLVIIVPVIVITFLIYGLYSRWCYHRTGHPLVAGMASAVAFAWAIAVTFPMIAN
jgi:pimeloyl-ACP methyl ester carboxylesterase